MDSVSPDWLIVNCIQMNTHQQNVEIDTFSFKYSSQNAYAIGDHIHGGNCPYIDCIAIEVKPICAE